MNTIVRISLLLLLPTLLFASGSSENGDGHGVTEAMALFVMQIGIIIFAARVGGLLFKKMHLPSVLGELVAGIIIGPHLLGGLSLPGFTDGIIPEVTMQMNGLATVASIILLFMAGLETDLKMFMRFSLAGSVVGFGGFLFSFIIGDLTAVLLLDQVDSFMDPQALLLGVMSTATSVGITVSILSEKRKLDSPEGVTILAGAVIDDILGIIALAIVLGIAATSSNGGHADWGSIGLIAAKAIGVWLGFTILGLVFAEKIGKFLKLNKNINLISVLSLGMALFLAGIFEQAGLAMIIGAYIMGLSLSKTDLNLAIQEHLHPLHVFFVPIFFAVMGMQVNLQEMFSPSMLLFGVVYALGAIIAKVIGSGGPSFFLNFNKLGALRVGLGMIPRGEVALIIGGIGLSREYLDPEVYSSSILMTLVTTMIAPVLLSRSLNKNKGTKKDVVFDEMIENNYEFPSAEIADLIETKLLQAFKSEGFFVNRVEAEEKIFRFQREATMITYTRHEKAMCIESVANDTIYVKGVVYETLADMQTVIEKLKNMAKPEKLKKEMAKQTKKFNLKEFHVFKPELITLDLKAKDKESAINELTQILFEHNVITDLEGARKVIFEREAAISTGMQHGVAIPHGRIEDVDRIHCVVGISKEGIDFASLDGELSRLFVLTVVPSKGQSPYMQFLAALSSTLNGKRKVERALEMRTKDDLIHFFES